MTLRPWECSCRTCSAEVSNRSTSYTWAFTLRSKGPVSCHCQVTCAGGFQRPAAEPVGVADGGAEPVGVADGGAEPVGVADGGAEPVGAAEGGGLPAGVNDGSAVHD